VTDLSQEPRKKCSINPNGTLRNLWEEEFASRLPWPP